LATQTEAPIRTLERVNACSAFQRGEGFPVVRGSGSIHRTFESTLAADGAECMKAEVAWCTGSLG
jgi:hypothetical protein